VGVREASGGEERNGLGSECGRDKHKLNIDIKIYLGLSEDNVNVRDGALEDVWLGNNEDDLNGKYSREQTS
jgi:hypothetical protein